MRRERSLPQPKHKGAEHRPSAAKTGQQHPADPSVTGHAGELDLHEIQVVQNGGEIVSGLVGLAARELPLGIVGERWPDRASVFDTWCAYRPHFIVANTPEGAEALTK